MKLLFVLSVVCDCVGYPCLPSRKPPLGTFSSAFFYSFFSKRLLLRWSSCTCLFVRSTAAVFDGAAQSCTWAVSYVSKLRAKRRVKHKLRQIFPETCVCIFYLNKNADKLSVSTFTLCYISGLCRVGELWAIPACCEPEPFTYNHLSQHLSHPSLRSPSPHSLYPLLPLNLAAFSLRLYPVHKGERFVTFITDSR